jgi:hypothetical protein
LGQYTFKPKTLTEIERRIGSDISLLVQNMESASMGLVGGMNEYTRFQKVRKLLEIPSIAGTEMGISTQFIHLVFLQLKTKEGELIAHCNQNNAYIIAGDFSVPTGKIAFLLPPHLTCSNMHFND